MQNIYVENLSKKITDEEFDLIIGSNQLLINEFCNKWDKEIPKIVPWTKDVKTDEKDWIMYLLDESSQGNNILAYHTQKSNAQVYGEVIVSNILRNGGCIINPKDSIVKDDKPDKIYDFKEQRRFQQISSVASALSHEIMETIIDPSCTILWLSNKTNVIFCAEVCDMVQENNVVVHYKGVDIYLSDFVCPSWLESYNTLGPFNYRRTLNAPFTLDKGGYAIVYSNINSTTILGKKAKNISRRMKMRGICEHKSCIIM